MSNIFFYCIYRGKPTFPNLLFIVSFILGCIEVSIMHPLDLVKTRFQIQATPIAGQESQHYTGIVDCMKKMYRSEGLLSFWKGILPPIFAETPKRAWKVGHSLIVSET